MPQLTQHMMTGCIDGKQDKVLYQPMTDRHANVNSVSNVEQYGDYSGTWLMSGVCIHFIPFIAKNSDRILILNILKCGCLSKMGSQVHCLSET